MKVLMLANASQGLRCFRLELIRELTKDHEVWFSVPEASNDPDVVQLVGAGAHYIQTLHLNRRGKNPFEDALLLRHYLSLLTKLQPDVVLTYTIKSNVYGGMACTLKSVPYLVNVTGLGSAVEDGGPLEKLATALYGVGIRGARKTFFQNTANRDKFVSRGIVSSDYELLPGSGVNVEHFAYSDYPNEEAPITFITVGRVMRNKGTDELLEAARQVKGRHPEVRFVVLGSFDGNYDQLIAEAVSAGTIEYVSAQSDVRPYLAESHALVNPSWYEGMSNVCLEAAATGRPVIASDIPGCREIIDDGVTGLTFEVRNPESLVDVLERFISLTHEQRREMGRQGREKVAREFDRQIVVGRYKAAIDEIAAHSC